MTPPLAKSPRAKSPRATIALPDSEMLIGRGLLRDAAARFAPLTPQGMVFLVLDPAEALRAPAAALAEALTAAGLKVATRVLPSGEAAKTFPELARLCEAMLEAGLQRDGLVVSFGSGAVSDVAGLAAALVRRGVALAHCPTTLLAQVDAGLGGKTAINTAQGKNLVGAFYPPRLTLADTDLLITLDRRHLRAGYAEAFKHGWLDSAATLDALEKVRDAALRADPDALAEVVAIAAPIKARIVRADPYEHGARATLNFGHTFGHALETAYNHTEALLHGEAVAMGMALAGRLSLALGMCAPADLARLEDGLNAAGLPTRTEALPKPLPGAAALEATMAQDKKIARGTLRLVLTHGLGKVALCEVDATIRAALRYLLQQEFASL